MEKIEFYKPVMRIFFKRSMIISLVLGILFSLTVTIALTEDEPAIRDDIIRFDFKSGDLQGWRIVEGDIGGWGHITFGNFTAKGRIDHETTSEMTEFREIHTLMKQIDPEALLMAIRDLTDTFPERYSHGQEYLRRMTEYEKQLPGIEKKLVQGKVESLEEIKEFYDRMRSFQHEALTANPLVSDQPLVFVVRHQYKKDHHNTATMFQTGEVNTLSFEGGGAMKTIDFGSGGEVKTLIDLSEGIIRDPEVYFNGEKIIFSMRHNIEDDFHIYEINADGTGLSQLTGAAGVTDIDPLYLPDDSIVFSSTREPKFCMCNKHIMANLFRMESAGANIHEIGKSTLHEAHGSLMPDGRILYDRWEYIDRNFGDAQGLWTVNPDGTNHVLYWGNNTNSPGSVIDARIIPGTQQVLCIFSSCHDRPWGALAIVDRRLGIDVRDPVIRTWPLRAINRVGVGNLDSFVSVTPKYEDPFVLSEKYFLCSRMTGRNEQMGIYLIDVFGNEILLHTEEPGCYDPMPLRPRKRPTIIPSRRNFENNEGSFYVVDVYNGTHMEGVKRGSVKYLRVIESPEKRYWNYLPWSGQGTLWPGMNWHDFCNKRILGTVPVEEDGSAYFSLPADKFVYFQLLDENEMMIQSMRSGTIVQSGELTGCIGCHENRRTAPPISGKKMPIAVEREPSKLKGWYGPPRLFNYMTEVQPVFDSSCVRCHDYGKPAGKKLNLAGDRTNTFNTSYNEIWRKKYITVVGGGPAEIQQPYSWGSHASKLVTVILEGHKDVPLDKESIDRIVTWIDINAPYYPVYSTAYPDNLAGRSPLNMMQLDRLSELTGIPFTGLADHVRNIGPQISFDRPELSPCLMKFENNNDPKYLEALAIIQYGKVMLEKQPRADMDGFRACLIDQLREGKYVMRQQIESRNREAIRNGGKAFDDRWK